MLTHGGHAMRRAAPLLAIVLILGLAIPALASTRGGGVRILKIVFDPPGADNGSNASLNKEIVVVVNDASSPVNMAGWTLRDRDQHTFRFPAFMLGAGVRITIHSGPGTNNAGNLHWYSDGYVWNNDGDTASLWRGNGSVADRCTYSGSGSVTTC
jgi:hypothetical protein